MVLSRFIQTIRQTTVIDDTINKYQTWKDNLKQWEAALELCLKAYNECENKIFLLQTNAAEEYEKALEEEVKWSDLLSEYIETVTPEGAIYKAKRLFFELFLKCPFHRNSGYCIKLIVTSLVVEDEIIADFHFRTNA